MSVARDASNCLGENEMIEDMVVVDATVHALNMDPSQQFEALRGLAPGALESGIALSPFASDHGWEDIHQTHSPKLGKHGSKYDRFVLSRVRWERRWTAEEVVAALFEESQTDIGVYHSNQGSPMAEGIRAVQMEPARMLLYGGLNDPFDTVRSIDEIDEWVERYKIIGLKFYPFHVNIRQGRSMPFALDDERYAYPIVEHALKRGIRSIAVHKAMGWVLKAFGVSDMVETAMAFPDMNFEIVHAGFAFLEDTAVLAGRANIWLNLESTSAYLSHAPRRFAQVVGRFMTSGIGEPNAEDRIIWSTGCMAGHAQPLLELFWNFQMPEDMVEDFGYRPLTADVKCKILGENFARMHGIDLAAINAAIPDTERRRAQLSGQLAEPWSKVPALA
jgi:predicted TIM-barrel fold metal-dependent hydrolase